MIGILICPGKWTHDRADIVPEKATSSSCEVCFCDRNTVHLATLVFIFQMVYGLVSLGCMVFMWYVDSKDDAAEMEEDLEWTRAEQAEAYTWKGKLKKVGECVCITFTSISLGWTTVSHGPFLQWQGGWYCPLNKRSASSHQLQHPCH